MIYATTAALRTDIVDERLYNYSIMVKLKTEEQESLVRIIKKAYNNDEFIKRVTSQDEDKRTVTNQLY